MASCVARHLRFRATFRWAVLFVLPETPSVRARVPMKQCRSILLKTVDKVEAATDVPGAAAIAGSGDADNCATSALVFSGVGQDMDIPIPAPPPTGDLSESLTVEVSVDFSVDLSEDSDSGSGVWRHGE